MDDLTDCNIPDDYIEIHSKMQGVDVFGPRSGTRAKRVPKSYECPECGANTQFDVSVAGIICEHCGYTAPVNAKQVGLPQSQHEFTLKTLSSAKQGWGIERKHMHCESCGAEFSISEDSISSTCPFCAANKVNTNPAPVDFLRPEYLIPFRISSENMQILVNDWLRKGWLHPSDVASNAILQKITGIYLPFWIFDAKINANWRANVNTFNEVAVEGENNTQVEIKDGSVSGQTQLEIKNIPQPGTNKASHILLKKLKPFHFEELEAYSPDYLAGWQAQHYNIPLEASWTVAKEEIRGIAKSTIRQQINGTKIRNFSMTANFPNETWRYVLLPVYLAAYKYKGRIFQVMVNGQTGAVAGQKPVVWAKIWLAIALFLAPGIGLGHWVFPRLLVGTVGTGIFLLELALLVLGGLMSLSALGEAWDSQNA